MQPTTITLTDFIKANLHQLTPTRPLIVPMTNITITSADFDHVAEGSRLGEILSCTADMHWVSLRLAIIAMLRQNNEDVNAPMLYARIVNSPPKPYLTVPTRAIIVFERDGYYQVCDCAVHSGIFIKWVQQIPTCPEAIALARQWVKDYQS